MNRQATYFSDWRKQLQSTPKNLLTGSVVSVSGPKIRAAMVGAAVGDLATIAGRSGAVRGQIVGVSRDEVIISPFDPLQGIQSGAQVSIDSRGPSMLLGDHLLGCVLNGMGEVLAAEGPELSEGDEPNAISGQARFGDIRSLDRRQRVPIAQDAPAALRRRPIHRQLYTGVRAIDAFVPIGQGQRLCVMAEPGVGKSTLFGMIAKRTSADVTVLALIGERGREVNELLYDTLDEQTRQRCISVVSTGDEPALRRIFAAHTATRIAEHFRAQGRNVLLLMDSLTRLCRAYREVGLAAGEPPVRRGYPPSVFSELPRLIERTGCDERGSITALYTMLLSSDLDEDPMVDEVKGLTDGHLMLRSALAEQGHYPAIDVVSSISRLTNTLQGETLRKQVRSLRAMLARLGRDRELALLSDRVDPELSNALKVEPEILAFLKQDTRSAPLQGSELNAEIERLWLLLQST